MTQDQIQTLLSESGCIESCLSGKMLLAVIVQLIFDAGGIPAPMIHNYRVTDDGSVRIASDDFIRIVDV